MTPLIDFYRGVFPLPAASDRRWPPAPYYDHERRCPLLLPLPFPRCSCCLRSWGRRGRGDHSGFGLAEGGGWRGRQHRAGRAQRHATMAPAEEAVLVTGEEGEEERVAPLIVGAGGSGGDYGQRLLAEGQEHFCRIDAPGWKLVRGEGKMPKLVLHVIEASHCLWL